jgi:hypothetical protein
LASALVVIGTGGAAAAAIFLQPSSTPSVRASPDAAAYGEAPVSASWSGAADDGRLLAPPIGAPAGDGAGDLGEARSGAAPALRAAPPSPGGGFDVCQEGAQRRVPAGCCGRQGDKISWTIEECIGGAWVPVAALCTGLCPHP